MARLPIRRTIPELTLRLEREAGHADLWVEGEFDRAVLSHVLRLKDVRNVSCYLIDDLDVPSELHTGVNTPGNRDRVLAASAEVSRLMHGPPSNIVFTVDKDSDVLNSTCEYGPLVIPTDGTCIEQYLWNAAALDDMSELALGIETPESQSVLDALSPILHDLFLIRAAQHRLGMGVRLSSARPMVSVSQGGLTFDRSEYLDRLANSGEGGGRRAELETEVEGLRAAHPVTDPPHMNGHDMFDLLGHALRPRTPAAKRNLLQPDSLTRFAVLAVDWESVVAGSDQFRRLLEKLEAFS